MITSRLIPLAAVVALGVCVSDAHCKSISKADAKSVATQEGISDAWAIEVDSSGDGETDAFIFAYSKPMQLTQGSCSTTEHGLGVKRQGKKIEVIHRAKTEKLFFGSCTGVRIDDFAAVYDSSHSMSLTSVAELITSGVTLFGGQSSSTSFSSSNLEKAYKGLSRSDLSRVVVNNDHELSALFQAADVSPELLAIRVSKNADGKITSLITTSNGSSPAEK